jgi:hypothetical protein
MGQILSDPQAKYYGQTNIDGDMVAFRRFARVKQQRSYLQAA